MQQQEWCLVIDELGRMKELNGSEDICVCRPQEKRTKLMAAIAKEHMDPMLPGDFYSALFAPSASDLSAVVA